MTTNNGKIIKYVLISVAVAFVLFIAYAVKESRKHPTPIGEFGSTVVMSGDRPDKGTLRESKESSESKTSEDREIPTTRYPWCDTDDIVLPDKSQKWSACNVGATKASMYASCQFQSDRNADSPCPEEIGGKYFKWGNNEPYESGSTIVSSTWANAWWAVTKSPELMRGPCADWYHIPSAKDVKAALSIRIPEPFDPNAPWKAKDREFEKEFRDFLKIPKMAGYSPLRGSSMDHRLIPIREDMAYFWTNELSQLTQQNALDSNNEGHHPVEVEISKERGIILVNYFYKLSDDNYYGHKEDFTDTSLHAIPVRCIKDDLYSK